MAIDRKKLWLCAIGASLIVATGVLSTEWYAAYKVDRYMNEWFAKNISYAGKRTVRFSKASMRGGAVELHYRGTVTLFNGRAYEDEYVFTLLPAKGSGSLGSIRMIHAVGK